MTRVRFIVYSDIHHDRLAARCITLKDTLDIESRVLRRVVEGDFDFSLFLGDRFLKREPEDEVKVRADMALVEAFQGRKDGRPHFSLVGNHDWTKNNREWHTSKSAQALNRWVILMDRAGTWGCPNCLIHALPAGVPFDRSAFNPEAGKFNLFVFHDMVKGAFMADDGDMTFEEGIPLSTIDLPEWNFVLAGDIHVPQQFNLKNSSGGYVGSVLQRTRADADRRRGWLEVTATQEEKGCPWNVETAFVATRPFFHRESFEVGPTTQYHDLVSKIDENAVNDVAVEVRLRGKREDVDRIADESKWQNYVDVLSARSIEIVRDYQTEQSASVVDLSTSSGVEDDLKLYLGSGFVNVGTLPPARIFEMIRRVQG